MNKKPILLRSLFALLILAVFLFSMFPLGQTDFYKSMKTMFTNPDDPKIEEVIALATKLICEGMSSVVRY